MRKQIKRSLSLLCVLAIFATFLTVHAVSGVTITAQTKTLTYPDFGNLSAVTVDLTMEDNTGIAGCVLYVTYDAELELKEVKKGSALPGLDFLAGGDLTANPIKLVWAGETADSSNGTIATLTFSVPKKIGQYAITVSSGTGDVYDNNLTDVPATCVAGGITLAKASGYTMTLSNLTQNVPNTTAIKAVTATPSVTDRTAQIVVEYSSDDGKTWTTDAPTSFGTYLVRAYVTGADFMEPMDADDAIQETLKISRSIVVPVSGGGAGSSGGSTTPSTPATTTDPSTGTITPAAMDTLTGADAGVTVEGDNNSKVAIDSKTLKNISTAAGKNTVQVNLKDVTAANVSTYPGKSVFDMTVTSGGKELDVDGKVTVTLPCVLNEGEQGVVWKVDADGTVTKMTGSYDPVSQKITVVDSGTKHRYVVGPDSDMPFIDVNVGDYFYDAVAWALKNGVTAGTSPTTFSPDASATRGQTVTFLWNASGKPEPAAGNRFTDVKESDYYYKAVQWAAEQGITAGTGDGSTFSPNDTVTRAQIVTFLYRLTGVEPTVENKFTDVSANDYFNVPVSWAAQYNVTSGTGDGSTFSPHADCLRAQIVTFLYRCFAK